MTPPPPQNTCQHERKQEACPHAATTATQGMTKKTGVADSTTQANYRRAKTPPHPISPTHSLGCQCRGEEHFKAVTKGSNPRESKLKPNRKHNTPTHQRTGANKYTEPARQGMAKRGSHAPPHMLSDSPRGKHKVHLHTDTDTHTSQRPLPAVTNGKKSGKRHP